MAGTKVGKKPTTVPQGHLLWDVSISVQTSSPGRFEWVKMELDTGAAANTCPLNFGPDGAGDRIFHRTAGGERILAGGGWQLRGHAEKVVSPTTVARWADQATLMWTDSSAHGGRGKLNSAACGPVPTDLLPGQSSRDVEDYVVPHLRPRHHAHRLRWNGSGNQGTSQEDGFSWRTCAHLEHAFGHP